MTRSHLRDREECAEYARGIIDAVKITRRPFFVLNPGDGVVGDYVMLAVSRVDEGSGTLIRVTADGGQASTMSGQLPPLIHFAAGQGWLDERPARDDQHAREETRPR